MDATLALIEDNAPEGSILTAGVCGEQTIDHGGDCSQALGGVRVHGPAFQNIEKRSLAGHARIYKTREHGQNNRRHRDRGSEL